MEKLFNARSILVAACLVASCAGTEKSVRSLTAVVEPAPIEAGAAPSPGEYSSAFDALHYDVSLVLPDTGTFITGETTARVLVKESLGQPLSLDFSGLAVTHVRFDGRTTPVDYSEGKLRIPLDGVEAGDTVSITVAYSGRPDDGLILSRNVHGHPTAFADNWPNRARYWFPSIDHPSDKASVDFAVRAPPDLQVIANGRLISSEGSLWRWTNPEPIPTYTMVIGAAPFAVERTGVACDETSCVDVETWLFPPDTARARPSFERADEMVIYFSGLIAPFPYAKLAHVQASTRFGGMENVSAIFYPEDALAEGRNIEPTVAHETAHQWFGDAVTESDWNHLWLSEGFATYFAALFFEHADGTERFREIMEDSRRQYLSSDVTTIPIVQEAEDNLFYLLNANNYDKGAWVLHMLRRLLGEEAFFVGIRDYYRSFEHATALTDDLRAALERASGRSLEEFFRQWVYSPGHPRLRLRWSAETPVRVHLEQVQPWPAFQFPLTVEFESGGEKLRQTVEVAGSRAQFEFELPSAPTAMRVDPDGDVLLEVESLVRE